MNVVFTPNSFWLRLLEFAANGGALLVHSALKATLLLLVGGAVVGGLRRSSAALRHTLWLVCCLGLLLLPVFTLGLPAWQPAVVKPVMNSVMNTAPVAVTNSSQQADPTQATTFLLLRSIAAGHTDATEYVPLISTEQWALAALFGCWLLGAVVVTRKLVLGLVAAKRLQRRGRPVREGQLWEEFTQVTASLGLLTTRPRLLLVDDEALMVPLTWGCWRPVVLMPQASLQWSSACRRAALLHELSHIRRFDWFAQSLASLACLLYWFHPLVWFAAKRLRLESERATDDQVLATGIKATDYSSSLLEIVRFVGTHRWSGANRKDSLMKFAVPMSGTSKIEIRLRSILDPKQSRSAVTKRAFVAVSLVALAALVPLAAAKETATVTTDLSSPESTIRSFVAAFEANQFSTALTCVAGKTSPGPILRALEKRMQMMPRNRLPLGPMKTTIKGNQAQVIIGGRSNMETLSWDNRVIANGEPVSGPVLMRHETDGWKIVPGSIKPIGKYSVLPSIAKGMKEDLVSPTISNAAKSDPTLAECTLNIGQLYGAMSWPGTGHKLDLKNWKQKFTTYMQRGMPPGTNFDDVFYCPDDKSGLISYSINQNLDGVDNEVAFKNGKRTVFLYEGHNGHLDFRHNGRALVAVVDGGPRLVTPQEAKTLIWKPTP